MKYYFVYTTLVLSLIKTFCHAKPFNQHSSDGSRMDTSLLDYSQIAFLKTKREEAISRTDYQYVTAEKETSREETTLSLTSNKESSLDALDNGLSNALLETPTFLQLVIPTKTHFYNTVITEYNTVYIYPDATETATVTETDTSYYFTFRPGDVSIFTDALESQSTITLTAYVQDFAYSGVMVTPPVEYTTEYFTTTTTVDQITKLQPSTVYTTVPTTLTDTTTITVTTQALNVMETVTSNYYVTTTSTSAETNLQTDVMWVQTLLDETTTYVYTMRSLDRFQPYYLSTQVLHSTATITALTTTTTTPPPPPVEIQDTTLQGIPSSPSSSSSSSSSSSNHNDDYGCPYIKMNARECLRIM